MPASKPVRDVSAARRAWRRLATFTAGWTVIVVGIILLPLPGPGTLIILGGVSLLAQEFRWARRLKLIVLRRAWTILLSKAYLADT